MEVNCLRKWPLGTYNRRFTRGSLMGKKHLSIFLPMFCCGLVLFCFLNQLYLFSSAVFPTSENSWEVQETFH